MAAMRREFHRGYRSAVWIHSKKPISYSAGLIKKCVVLIREATKDLFLLPFSRKQRSFVSRRMTGGGKNASVYATGEKPTFSKTVMAVSVFRKSRKAWAASAC